MELTRVEGSGSPPRRPERSTGNRSGGSPLGSQTVSLRAGGDKWRETARRIYEYLRREMSDAEVQRKRIYPLTWDTQIQRTIPLIWRMARELATLYLRPPLREFLVNGHRSDRSASIEAEYLRRQVNRRMRTAQEHFSALQNATLWVWLTSDGYRLLTPPIHDQWVYCSRVDAQEVDDVAEWRIRFPVVSDPFATSVPTATALITRDIAVWESGPKSWVGQGLWDTSGGIRNPWGRIPVVYFRATDPAPGEFFVPVPEDSLDGQRAVNHDYTDMGTTARKQSHGQAKAKGLTQTQADELNTGPDTVVGVPADGDFDYARPGADLAGYGQQLDAFVKMFIAASGMSPATVMKSTGITALAKIVENIDREVERQRAKDEFEAGEQRLYSLIQQATELRSDGLEVLPRDVTVRVTYREPMQPTDPTNDAQAKVQRIAMRLDSAATIVAAEKAISVDEAQTIVLENERLEAELAATRAPIDTAPSTPTTDTTPKDQTDMTTTDGAPPALEASGQVQQAALNGAQVLAMKAIITDAATGVIPRETARALILAAYPVKPEAVDAMLSPLEGFVPAGVPAVVPATPPEATV